MGVMTVRELNANVSQALARAEAGEIVSITKNGKPIAELRPTQIVRDEKWHVARDRMLELMKNKWGHFDGKITYEDRHGPADL
jgi:prevent-host-death family protein